MYNDYHNADSDNHDINLIEILRYTQRKDCLKKLGFFTIKMN